MTSNDEGYKKHFRFGNLDRKFVSSTCSDPHTFDCITLHAGADVKPHAIPRKLGIFRNLQTQERIKKLRTCQNWIKVVLLCSMSYLILAESRQPIESISFDTVLGGRQQRTLQNHTFAHEALCFSSMFSFLGARRASRRSHTVGGPIHACPLYTSLPKSQKLIYYCMLMLRVMLSCKSSIQLYVDRVFFFLVEVFV